MLVRRRERPNGVTPRVVLHLEDGGRLISLYASSSTAHFGIGDHGTEFVHREEASVQAAALLSKKDGAGGGSLIMMATAAGPAARG